MNQAPAARQIEVKVKSLPLIDPDTAEIFDLLDDPESNYDRIARKLSPGLAARFLALVNSDPGKREVRSIQLAVKLLGFDKMRSALTSAIAVDQLAHRLDQFDFGKFLSQAHFCAAVARVLGDIMNFGARGDLMTVATLQNIGKLVIAVYFTDQHHAIIALKREKKLPTSLAERQIMGLSHGEIGAIVLERYRVPSEICEAVRYHDHHIPVHADRPLTELQVISREATTLVSRFQLPSAFDPVELPERLARTIEAGRQMRMQLAQPHILSVGYEAAFPKLTSQLSTLVFNDLRRLLPVRKSNE
jgi:HD-like signal output (HDOD) protein